MENILSVKNLSFSYGVADVLKDISFSIKAGSFVALAGPNGAGKSTLVKLILGLEKKSQGSIEIFDQKIDNFSAWSRIGYLPQKVNVFNPLFPASVKEVVRSGLLAAKKYPKKFNDKDDTLVAETLSLLGISDLKNRPIAELSGGQQQKVFLARALVSGPELLIMDEPSTALDPETRDSFFKLLQKLNQEKAVSIIMITHDSAQVGAYAEKLLYLDREVIFFGDFADFCHSKDMEKYFGHFSHHLICHQH